MSDVDEKPSALALSRATHSLAENTSTSTRLKMADITMSDDALGSNTLSVAGTDAASFEIYDGDLYLKSGVAFNYETKASYSVSVSVAGTGSGSNPVAQAFSLTLTDINEAPSSVTAGKIVTTGQAKSNYQLSASDITISDPDGDNWAAITLSALPAATQVALDYNDNGSWKEIIGDDQTVVGNQIKLASVGKITRSDINKLRFVPDDSYQAPPNGVKPSFGFTLHDRATGSADKTGNLFILTISANSPPVITATGSQSLSLSETSASSAADTGYSLSATDPDGANSAISWALSDSRFALENSAGANAGKLSVKASQSFDYETDTIKTGAQAGKIKLTATATDTDGLSTAHILYITLSDVDEKPSALTLSRTSHSLAENTSTSTRLKMADITITDDALGSNTLSVAGTDAASFEIYEGDLYLKSGVSLNYESKSSYSVSVSVSGTGTGSNPAAQAFSLTVSDVNEAPTALALIPPSLSLSEDTSTASRITLASLAISDDALGAETISLSGTDASSFEVIGGVLYLKSGVSLDYETKSSYALTLSARDSSIAGSTALTANYTLSILDVNENPSAFISLAYPPMR